MSINAKNLESAHDYIGEALNDMFEGRPNAGPRRATANAAISIAMSLETIADHLAYLAVKLAETPEPFADRQKYTESDEELVLPPDCHCGQCGPAGDIYWREKWQRDIDANPMQHPATTYPLPPRDTDAIHPYRNR